MGNQPGGAQSYFEHTPTAAQYGEAQLAGKMTLAKVRALMRQFQRPMASTLHPDMAERLLEMCHAELMNTGAGLELDVPAGTTLTVVGDLHGQMFDLMKIFAFNGEPSMSNRYLFDGDFVDRGRHGAEVFLTLAAWKVLYPDYVHMLRGNHEVSTINEYYGFEEELRLKYPSKPGMRQQFNKVFAALPVWAIVKAKIFVVHGGLPKRACEINATTLRKLSKRMEPEQESVLQDLLWSDPQEPEGFESSERGAGVMWGPDITDQFLELNNLDMIIRAHQMCNDGYRMQHNGKVLTVFSAPNYCGRCGNRAAITRISPDLSLTIHTFSAANATAVMNRAQDVAPQVPLTHAVGTILHHKSRKPYFLSDHPDQAVDVQPVCRGHAVNTGASGLCYNGDGTLLVSVSPKDGTLQMWNVSDDGHDSVVSISLGNRPNKICWFEDRIAVGYIDGSLSIFASEAVMLTGQKVEATRDEIQDMETKFAAEFFPMQDMYDTADDDTKRELNQKFEKLQVIRIQSQEGLRGKIESIENELTEEAYSIQNHEDCVTQLLWSKDGQRLASCARDCRLIVWECEFTSLESDGSKAEREENVPSSKYMLKPLVTVATPVPLADIAWHANDYIIASAARDGRIRVFDVSVADGSDGQDFAQELANFPIQTPNPPTAYSIAFNSTGDLLAVGCKDESVYLFDEQVNGGQYSYSLLQRLEASHSAGVTHLSFSSDDRVIASAGADHTLRLWSVDEAKELDTLVQTIERQMQLVAHESTERERESWRQQITEFKQSVQKAVLVGLSEKPHEIAWKPMAGPPYGIAVAADGDVPVGVWEMPSI